MSRELKYFLSFLFGAGIGSAISFYISRDHFDQVLAEEIEKYTARAEEKKAQKKETPVIEVQIDPGLREKKEEERNSAPLMNSREEVHYENYAKKYRTKAKIKPAIDMEKLTTKDMKDMYEEQLEDETFDDEEDFEDDYIYPEEKRPDPYSVDPQGDTALNSSYDKTTLLWYSKDDILIVEDTEERFEDPDRFLGEKWRRAIGQYEPDVAYIRNDNFETDYEIVKQNGRYFGE